MPNVLAELWLKPDSTFELRHLGSEADPAPDTHLYGFVTIRDDGALGWEAAADQLDEPRR